MLSQPAAPQIEEGSSFLSGLPEFAAGDSASGRDGIHLVEPVRAQIKPAPWPVAMEIPVQLSLFG